MTPSRLSSLEIDVSHQTVTWLCADCGDLIADGDGYLCLPFAEMRRYRSERKAWKELHPNGTTDELGFLDWKAFWSKPEEAAWNTWHLRCDPEPEASFYFIGVERIRTPWDVIHWTAHLLGKRWIDQTNWVDLLHAISDRRVRD
jgi:hypothetical protein